MDPFQVLVEGIHNASPEELRSMDRHLDAQADRWTVDTLRLRIAGRLRHLGYREESLAMVQRVVEAEGVDAKTLLEGVATLSLVYERNDLAASAWSADEPPQEPLLEAVTKAFQASVRASTELLILSTQRESRERVGRILFELQVASQIVNVGSVSLAAALVNLREDADLLRTHFDLIESVVRDLRLGRVKKGDLNNALDRLAQCVEENRPYL